MNLTSLRMEPALQTKSCYIIQQIIQELVDVRSYLFDYGTSPFIFSPGQFSVVSLPEAAIEAPITLSSSPTQEQTFQITIKKKGEFGTKFYDLARVGTIVTIGKPAGNFRLRPELGPVCFVGRDYGVTAARSFALYLAESPGTKEMTLLHELSEVGQALFAHEWTAPHYAWLRKYYLLDQPPSAASGSFWFGTVTPEAILKFIPAFSSTHYYLAGEGDDLLRWRKTLLDLQIPSGQIHTEKWSAASKPSSAVSLA